MNVATPRRCPWAKRLLLQRFHIVHGPENEAPGFPSYCVDVHYNVDDALVGESLCVLVSFSKRNVVGN